MSKLKEIIKNYLQAKDTDYAIMINGDWGCGKTYFLEHEFKDFVSKQNCPKESDACGLLRKIKKNQDEYKYTPVFVSLYGVSSLEDFQFRVFLGVNPWAKNQFVSVLGTLGSMVSSYFGISVGKGDTKTMTVVSEKMVLVFDDLERICTDKISVKEVLGLINDYSEHNHYKVVIVCNENVYKGKENEYSIYKEKTIRYTCEFEANVTTVYDTIADKYDENCKKYLEKQKPFLLSLFEKGGKKNLRTLKFFMDSMQEIYKTMPDVEYKEEILRTLSVSTMIYAIEYKKGARENELGKLKAQYEIDLGDYGLCNEKETTSDNETKETLPEKVLEIYGPFYRDEMVELPFIIKYLITGYLDNESLCEWAKKRDEELGNARIKEEYKLFKELSSLESVEDDSLVEKLEMMITYVKKGSYTVFDLMQVYALLLKYDYLGIEGFSLTEEIDNDFILALDKYKDNWKYVPNLGYKIPVWSNREKDSQSFKKYEKVKEHLFNINEQSKIDEEKKKFHEFMEVAKSNDVVKLKCYRNSEKWIRFEVFDWNEVCKMLESGKNPIACEIVKYLENSIEELPNVSPDDLKPLRNWLSNYANQEDKRIRRHFIIGLKKQIDMMLPVENHSYD